MKILSTLVAAVALTAVPPAIAQTAAGSASVSYADLDLSTPAGVRKLDRRIRSAVERACGPTSSSDPAGTRAVLECREETLALARVHRDAVITAETQASQVRLAAQR